MSDSRYARGFALSYQQPCESFRILLHHEPESGLAVGGPGGPAMLSRWSLDFDGIDQYMVLPEMQPVYGISLWVWIKSSQPNLDYYLLDARPGNVEGFFSNT